MTRKAAKPVQAEKRDPFIALPMVQELSGKGRGRSFWVIKRTGDYAFDCALGSGLAKLTGDVNPRDELAEALHCMILNMVKQGEASGVEVGFLSTITRAAARGWPA